MELLANKTTNSSLFCVIYSLVFGQNAILDLYVFYIKQLENLKSGKSPRPDDTHLRLLWRIKCEIAEVLLRTCDTS